MKFAVTTDNVNLADNFVTPEYLHFVRRPIENAVSTMWLLAEGVRRLYISLFIRNYVITYA
jgi:hypothetical protein